MTVIEGTADASTLDKRAAIADETRRYCEGVLPEEEIAEIVAECVSGAPEASSADDLAQLVALAFRARIERDPVYSSLAARVVCNTLYRTILAVEDFDPEFESAHAAAFPRQIQEGIESGVLDRRLADYDLGRLADRLRPERDRLLKYMAVEMLRDRFLARDVRQRRLETPQYFWMRIAMGLALAEPPERRETCALEFYEAMSTLRSLPSTSPTLYHIGTAHPQVGCFVLSVRDDLGHIFRTISTDAEIASISAGFGNDWTNVRGTCAWDENRLVESQGPISFLKVLDSSVAAFNRSGRRHSAACAYLETWHYDIDDFLSLRRSTGDERRRVSDISTANWIPDLFLKRVEEDGDWTLFSPDEVPDLHEAYGREFERRYVEYERKADRGEIRLWRRLRARELWRRMITRLFETGHPWMTFKDACNVRSTQDHVGAVGSANLCTEIILNASPEGVGVTTLGSVNLARHLVDGAIDYDALARSVRVGVRMLDDALDVSEYPTPAIQAYALTHRPIGLGFMGLQDVLYELGVDFDSEEACELSDRVTEFVAHEAIAASCDLADEKGRYATFAGSKWDRGIFPLDTLDLLEAERGRPVDVDRVARLDWTGLRERVRDSGLRNCNLLSIAPTQTLANLAGCFPAIEPAYKQLYVKSNSSGEFTVINEYLVRDLCERGVWSRELAGEIKRHDGSVQPIATLPADVRRRYKGAFEIDPIWVLRHAARRGKWIDQGQSLNIFTTSTSGNYIADLYMTAWRIGLKTTYYLKTLGASSVEPSTVAGDGAEAPSAPGAPA